MLVGVVVGGVLMFLVNVLYKRFLSRKLFVYSPFNVSLVPKHMSLSLSIYGNLLSPSKHITHHLDGANCLILTPEHGLV
jgi:hypothetical protein